jgi:hypothetical protein
VAARPCRSASIKQVTISGVLCGSSQESDNQEPEHDRHGSQENENQKSQHPGIVSRECGTAISHGSANNDLLPRKSLFYGGLSAIGSLCPFRAPRQVTDRSFDKPNGLPLAGPYGSQLAAMSWQRPNIGSRMNREVHVRVRVPMSRLALMPVGRPTGSGACVQGALLIPT